MKVRESSAYVEVGGYVLQNEGETKTQLLVSDVNKPLVVEDAAITKRLKKVRVTMNVEEDKTPQHDRVYEKRIWMEQESSDDEKKGRTTSSEKKVLDEMMKPIEEDGEDVDEPGKMSGLRVLKNFVDNIAEEQRTYSVLLFIVAMFAVAAFVLAVVG